ncbi:sulfatase-like hydrolase/transferase [Pseudomonas sp. PDNC002]|uniref:sulfatase-like hydrolase/transferase n=1 Tax=Pseudomonas sp. PDNC002 TaxID=2811422 RepID=UPI001F057B13|nr:sulfatase-like hydrolase/transferase [Pseudomonas sp. PDNC002]
MILLASMACSNAQDQSSRPNILFILADDLGNNDIASWGDGQAPTPTLDQLSQQSLRFRQHYTDSTCSVSRAALLTGRAPVNIGFEPDGLGLSPDLDTLPKSLHKLGYSTHHLGKWHVGEGLEYLQIRPNHQGFDDWFGMLNHFVLQGPDANGKLIRRKPTFNDPWLQRDDGPPQQYKGHLDDLLTDRAIDLIQNGRVDGKPWFINLWLLSPHHPFEPSDAFRRQFPDTDEGRYLAVLKQLDHNVARLLEALSRSGQLDDTLIVFTSDNGSPNLARDSNYPLTGTKATYFEGGVRAPLLIMWPGHTTGRDVVGVSRITDLYPTLVGMVGGVPPKGLNGRDLSAQLNATAPLPPVGAQYWAADVMDWGMTYAGHLPGRGLFYRNLFAKLESRPVTGPIGAPATAPAVSTTFNHEEASSLIGAWERKNRPVPLQWHPAEGARPAYASGRDFQRSPVFGGFSLGLAATRSVGAGRQILVDQPGIWSLALEQKRLVVTHGARRFQSEPVALREGCNSIVTSFNIKPASSFPFPGPEKGLLAIYLNGRAVLNADQAMPREVSAEAMAVPTYIGAAADGSQRYGGRIGPPQLVGKYLLPEQDGYRLADMQSSLCPGATR